MWLTRLALRNPIFILMMSLMTVVLGVVSLDRLAVDLFRTSRFRDPGGDVLYRRWPARYREIHHVAGRARGLGHARNRSRRERVAPGRIRVSAWFDYGTNLDNAQFDVSQRVAQILSTLPPGNPAALRHQVRHHHMPVAQV